MMPLSMVNEGEPQVIKKVGGKEETRKFLENLGFVQGATVTVVSEIGGNMIVNVKDSRVAIGKDMANRIMLPLISLTTVTVAPCTNPRFSRNLRVNTGCWKTACWAWLRALPSSAGP